MEREKNEADNEGQAFLGDRENDETTQPGLEATKKRRRFNLGVMRISVEIAMLILILVLLTVKPYCGRDTIRRTPVPRRKLWCRQARGCMY